MSNEYDQLPTPGAASAKPRFEASGTDVDEALALFQQGYNASGFHVERGQDPFHFRYTITGDGAVTLRSSSFTGSIRGTVQLKDEYVVSWLRSGSGVMDVGADEHVMRPGIPAMFPTNKRYAFHFRDYRQNLIHFDAPLLERIAAERVGAEPSRLHFAHTSVPSGDALRRWWEAVTVVANTLLITNPDELLRVETENLAATALLDAFPYIGPERPRLVIPPTHAGLASALEFIHEHPDRALTTTEIAKAAGVSIRGLQHAFAQELETSPSEYLRGIRLDRVRAELRAATPPETTVSEIARRWGFAHSGRFSSSYVQRFDEYPAQTLGR